MKRYAILMSALVCFLLAAAVGAAAQAESATVQGSVVDQQGQPVVGAVVSFHGANTGATFSTKTDKKGEFLKIGVKGDLYRVTVTKDGQEIAQVASYPVSYSSAPAPLTITAGKPSAAPAALTLPVSSVPLTAAQQKALDEVKKQAAAAPKANDKQVKDKLQAGQVAVNAGNFDQAATIFTDVTTMDPMSDAGWAQLGFCYAKMGKNDLAVAALEKAVALSPSYGPYHQNLAISYAKTGQGDQAEAELATAAQVDPSNAARYFMYEGLLLAQEKKSEQAVAAFDKAIATDPQMADAYYFKGLTLMDQAQTSNGKLSAPAGTAEAFKKYLELQPNGPRAADAKAKLSKLGG